MKRNKKWLVGGLALLSATCFALGLVACAPETPDPDPNPGHGPGSDPNHVCETKCPECGLCLNMECSESACAEKCGDAALYSWIFNATELKVAKSYKSTDIVNAGGGYIDNFTKANDASIVYNLDVEKAGTATLMLTVSMTDEADVYTDSVDVFVNNQKISRGTVVPAKSGSASTWVEINLGCIELAKGVNEIAFVAQGDGAQAHNFQKIELLVDADISLVRATERWHDCESVCPDCGGCLDYTCFNPGCATKCTDMTESKEEAHLFWVFDDHVTTNRDVNPELSGVGASWGQVTSMTWIIYSPEDVTVEFGAVISTMLRATVHFTTQFTVTVNGQRVTGDGYCPTIEEGESVKYAPDDFHRTNNNPGGITAGDLSRSYDGDSNYGWNCYKLAVAGKMNLKKGANVIQIDQDLRNKTSASWALAYNFQTFVLFTDKNVGWYESEHTLVHHDAVDATCGANGVKEYWECTDDGCGKLFADADGIEEVEYEDLVIPANDDAHVWTEADDTKYSCSVCGNEAYRFSVFDTDHFESSRKPGNDGIGASWGQETWLTFYVNAEKAGTAKLIMKISRDTKELLFTDVISVYVNGSETPLVGTGVIPGYPSRATATYDMIIVGEVELDAGFNTIHFTYVPRNSGDGALGVYFNFLEMTLYSKDSTFGWYEPEHTLEYREEVPNTCGDDGMLAHWACTDDDCGKLFADKWGNEEVSREELLIPANSTAHAWDKADDTKLVCSVCTTEAPIFTTTDTDHVITNTAAKAGEGIGSKWDVETRFTYYLNAEKAGKALLVVSISSDTKELLFTDVYSVYVNGSETPLVGTGKIPAKAKRDWLSFNIINVGEVELKEGLNTLTFSFTPRNSGEGALNVAYNFLELALSAKDNTIGWYESEHTLELQAAVAPTCQNAGSIEHYKCTDADCGKLFADKLGAVELTADKVTVPADESAHKWKDETTKLTCTVCSKVEENIFDAMDDKVTFELLSGGNWAPDSKNTSENCIPGKNGYTHRFTFYITSDKDTTAHLWTNVSAISGSYQIRYDATWTVTVNGVAISTDTIHHNTSQTGASNRFADFLYEYVCVIALKQGVNVIEFTTTTKESLNFRSLALAATDAELELVEKPTEAAPEAVEVALPSKEYLF